MYVFCIIDKTLLTTFSCRLFKVTNLYFPVVLTLYLWTSSYSFKSGNLDKSSKLTLNLSTKKIDKEYKSHDIKITKEIDRLVIKGRFKKCSEVNIVLYKDFNSKIYDFPVSKKPYTALCVDILTDEENENGIVVTKYINNEGLKGIYSIYLEIDGKLYDTEKYVKF